MPDDPPTPPAGWYTRGYLPHFNNRHTIQSVTFRLADSLPQVKLRQLDAELAHLPLAELDVAKRKRIETWLDAGMGCCALKNPELASLMQDTLLKWDGERYRLLAWCVMPNHAHVLLETLVDLPKIVQSWKSYTGRWAMMRNMELALGIPGTSLWMREYWDRYVRDLDHLENVRRYIVQNPVKARLCLEPADWPWSSAGTPWDR